MTYRTGMAMARIRWGRGDDETGIIGAFLAEQVTFDWCIEHEASVCPDGTRDHCYEEHNLGFGPQCHIVSARLVVEP